MRYLGFEPTGEPVALAGGLLNHVWRVPTASGSVVAKHAPSDVAGAILSPERVLLEARALALFEPDGVLGDLGSDALRPPRPLRADPARYLLVMEDVGELPSLDNWLLSADPDAAAKVGRRLATFLRRLHERTQGDATLAESFDNADVQRVRSQVQYGAVETWLRDFGHPDAAALGEVARTLGNTFEQPGRCLTMGDLWPRSVLVLPNTDLRIIDWEFAHVGRPAQDVGHLRAHLWMLRHTLGTPAARACHEAFGAAYPLGGEEDVLARRHAGCEVLIRTIGPFCEGYLYDNGASAAQIEQAVDRACSWLRA